MAAIHKNTLALCYNGSNTTFRSVEKYEEYYDGAPCAQDIFAYCVNIFDPLGYQIARGGS